MNWTLKSEVAKSSSRTDSSRPEIGGLQQKTHNHAMFIASEFWGRRSPPKHPWLNHMQSPAYPQGKETTPTSFGVSANRGELCRVTTGLSLHRVVSFLSVIWIHNWKPCKGVFTHSAAVTVSRRGSQGMRKCSQKSNFLQSERCVWILIVCVFRVKYEYRSEIISWAQESTEELRAWICNHR